MRDRIIRTGLAAIALSLGLPATPAAAQSFATYVSRTGNDAGNCTIAEPPCRNLFYALPRTAPGGTIQCLDSGVFSGSFTITQSVIIDCLAVSALNFLTITIDDSATAAPGSINVVLRGLRINGRSAGQSGSGIRFISGFSLTLEGIDVQNFTGDSFPTAGVFFAPTRAARLHIANSTIGNNGGSAATGAGIHIAPTGAGYANVTLENVQLVGNSIGLFVRAESGNSSSTNAVVNRSVISGGRNGVNVFAQIGTPGAAVTIANSTIGGATLAGLSANGGLAQIRVRTSTIAGNSLGVEGAGGGIVATYGNNALIGNGVNGAFNGFPTEN